MESRQLQLSNRNVTGACVIYVMSRDQRIADNHAMVIAQQKAVELRLPLFVVFNLLPSSGVRSREHYEFMIDGLEKVSMGLEALNIPLIMLSGDPNKSIPDLCDYITPSHIYFDFKPLSGVRKVQKAIADKVKASCTIVDTHNIIPAHVLSDKQEFAAHTIRHKIHKTLANYMVEPDRVIKHPFSAGKLPKSLSFADARKIISSIKSSGIKHGFASGEKAATSQLTSFITDNLESYATDRNNIAVDGQSDLSPYLHFGQISSLRVALEVMYYVDEQPLLLQQARMAQVGPVPSKLDGMNALFEEMIVRKELSDNFCLYTKDPTSLTSAPEWAQNTLAEHLDDTRDHLYTLEQLENAETYDNAWNASQRQLTRSGKIHGYMRMYWAKKILEWSETPEIAIKNAIYLNDHYSIDGGDPNGYVGILWAIAGLHDRPWQERPIFGKVRYMNEAGLRRKFDLDAYIKQWS